MSKYLFTKINVIKNFFYLVIDYNRLIYQFSLMINLKNFIYISIFDLYIFHISILYNLQI